MGWPWSRVAAGEGSSSSNSTPPDGIERINDAVYKFCEPTVPLNVEIVFIHGLQCFHYKDAYWKTWMGGEKSEICWPMKWLSEDLPGARIWSVSYDSCALRSNSTGRVDAYLLGESLVQNMVRLANIGQENCPIVFVCHCLGGLVVKEIVVKAHVKFGKEPKYVNFLRSIRGFFFFATPHEGLLTSFLADRHLHFSSCGDESVLIKQLRAINDDLGRLNAEFERIERILSAGMWKFSVVAETHATTLHEGFSAKVVEETSARHVYNDFLPVPADHFGVCTPKTKTSSSFQVLRDFVSEIVDEDTMVRSDPFELPECLVGMEYKLGEVMGKLDTHPSVVLVGMGGIGKTTLSKLFYNQRKKYYEKSCFLEDVKSAGIGAAQKQLFCDLCGNLDESRITHFHLKQIKQCIMTKKVLLVVDDVGSETNLKALLVHVFKDGKKGSKVIVTTRQQDVLGDCIDSEVLVDLDCLNDDQAYELFSYYAFCQLGDNERVELDGLAKHISKACGGLPLSIEVLGQFLKTYNSLSYADERRGIWEKALDKLQDAKSLNGSEDDRLWKRLRISYDDLDDDHKSMYLDFACILGEWLGCGWHNSNRKLGSLKEYLGRIWGDPLGVENLMRRSLIKWNSHQRMLVMHDQLRDLGRSIAASTRIWKKDEGLQFMKQNKFQSSNTLECLLLHGREDTDSCYKEDNEEEHDDLYEEHKEEQNPNKRRKKVLEEVERFEKLRLLNMSFDMPLQVVEYYISLCSKELRWLCLNFTSITATSIQDLGSFQKLRVLEMKGCKQLQQLPESIGSLCDLMELDLSYCFCLMSLPESIGMLKLLRRLDVGGCGSLKEIPGAVGKLPKLEHLLAHGCHKLGTLCEFGTEMYHLKELNLSCCCNLKTIKSLGNLRGLKSLNLEYNTDLHIDNLGDHLGQLSQLQELHLLQCTVMKEGIVETILEGQLHTGHLETLILPVIPEGGLPGCPRLQTLEMWNGLQVTEFVLLPGNLSHLERLSFDESTPDSSLKVLPDALCDLERLKQLDIKNFVVLERLPENLGRVSSLEELNLSGCRRLVELPTSLGSLSLLRKLDLNDCKALRFLPDSLGNLSQLQELDLSYCKALRFLPESLGNLSQLRELKLSYCKALRFIPESLGNLSQLQILDLSYCKALTFLPESLGNFSQLHILDLGSWEALTFLPDSLGNLSQLRELKLSYCKALTFLPDSLGNLSQLQILDLSYCEALTFLPDSLGNLSQLRELKLSYCKALTFLPESLGNLSQLQILDLSYCKALTFLPESLGNFSQLHILDLGSWEALTFLPDSLGNLSQLWKLDLGSCKALTFLPESLGNLSQLRELKLSYCNALRFIPESLGNLSQLRELKLSYCKALTFLPESLGNLSQLQILDLSYCEALRFLPESLGNLSQLWKLDLSYCKALTLLPESLGNLSQLWELDLGSCEALTFLPDSLGNLSQLWELDLSYCEALTFLPDSLGNLSQLRELKLSYCKALTFLPESLGNLSQLQILDLSYCKALTFLPESLGNLSQLWKLDLSYCKTLTLLPESLGNLSQLQSLNLGSCEALTFLPDSLGNFSQLQILQLGACNALERLSESLAQFPRLKSLFLDRRQREEVGQSILQQLEDGGCRIYDVLS